MTDHPPFRVLSLDGGGMRGTYTATYLDRVGEAFARRRGLASLDIGRSFDLIVGTSTGGIIACALAQGLALTEVVDLYRRHGPDIFSRNIPSSLPGLAADLSLRPRALAAGEGALRAALTAKLGDVTIGQMYERRGIALAIPAVEMSQHHAWVFKTPHFAGPTTATTTTALSMFASRPARPLSTDRLPRSIIPRGERDCRTTSLRTAVCGRITRF